LSKHIKYSCEKNKDEDFQELARLLNKNKNMTLIDELKEKNLVIKQITEEKKKLQKQITQLTDKLQIQFVGHQQNSNINAFQINQFDNSIHINNFKDTNYDFLTDLDYIKCIRTCNHSVKNLIEKVHFNEKHPENMNIYISSIKTDYLMLYKDGNWNIVDRSSHIDTLYDMNEIHLESWYEEYQYKNPQLIKSFERYLHNREDNEIINNVKKEIIRLLYNKRKLVLNRNSYLGSNLICPD
jgi:hypothetical protein